MDVEKENTFRALKDEDLIGTSRWCSFGFHKWTMWNNGNAQRNVYGDTYLIQQRICVHCNDFEQRRKGLKK